MEKTADIPRVHSHGNTCGNDVTTQHFKDLSDGDNIVCYYDFSGGCAVWATVAPRRAYCWWGACEAGRIPVAGVDNEEGRALLWWHSGEQEMGDNCSTLYV